VNWNKNIKPPEDICPEKFCFLWSGAEHRCRETFGKCRRITSISNDKDWYEPCEPELEKYDLPWFYFIANDSELENERKDEYQRESKELWGQNGDDRLCDKVPEIKVRFSLQGQSGNAIEFSQLTKGLAIIPTETRGLNDWPEAVKHPRIELPIELRPRCIWTVEVDYADCQAVSYRFAEMITVLRGKEKIINNLCTKLNLETHFDVVIYAHHCRLPELFLTKEVVQFIASIGADIGFDMYLD
jgi:hypothetical protein